MTWPPSVGAAFGFFACHFSAKMMYSTPRSRSLPSFSSYMRASGFCGSSTSSFT